MNRTSIITFWYNNNKSTDDVTEWNVLKVPLNYFQKLIRIVKIGISYNKYTMNFKTYNCKTSVGNIF